MQQRLTQNLGENLGVKRSIDLSNPTAIILSTHLVLGFNETQFLDVSLQSVNSRRDKMIGKKHLFKKHIPQSMGHLRRERVAEKVPCGQFHMGWVISQVNEWKDYFTYLGKGARISRIGPPSALWSLMISLRTVMVLVGVIQLADIFTMSVY